MSEAVRTYVGTSGTLDVLPIVGIPARTHWHTYQNRRHISQHMSEDLSKDM